MTETTHVHFSCSQADFVLGQIPSSTSFQFITARKRSLRRLYFHRCLSVHGGSWALSDGVSMSQSLSRVGLCSRMGGESLSMVGRSLPGGVALSRISVPGVSV